MRPEILQASWRWCTTSHGIRGCFGIPYMYLTSVPWTCASEAIPAEHTWHRITHCESAALEWIRVSSVAVTWTRHPNSCIHIFLRRKGHSQLQYMKYLHVFLLSWGGTPTCAVASLLYRLTIKLWLYCWTQAGRPLYISHRCAHLMNCTFTVQYKQGEHSVNSEALSWSLEPELEPHELDEEVTCLITDCITSELQDATNYNETTAKYTALHENILPFSNL